MRRVYFEQTRQGENFYRIQAFQPDASTEDVSWGVPGLLVLETGSWFFYNSSPCIGKTLTMVFTDHPSDAKIIRAAIDWFDNATMRREECD